MVTNPLSCIRRTALLSSPFILSLYPSLSAQQIYNGDVSLFEQTIEIPTVPLYVGYGENQDTNLTLNTTWISAGNGSRFGDSNGTGSRNTVVVDIGFYSQMEFQSGGRTYIG